MNGLFYGGGLGQLGLQALAVLAVAAWTAVTITITFFAINKTIGLRASVEEETRGLDVTEHGLASSYADFMPVLNTNSISVFTGETTEETVPAASANELIVSERPHIERSSTEKNKYTRISVVCKQNKFEELKRELSAVGVTGFTVTQVLGCGTQKGAGERYRGVPVEATDRKSVV